MEPIQISERDLRLRSLFIALPMYGGKADFLMVNGLAELTAMLKSLGINYGIYIMANESLITRARNYATDEFMRSGMTHMMFIDADIGFQAQSVVQMLALSDPMSDYDVLCGPYPKKHIAWNQVAKALLEKKITNPKHSSYEAFAGEFVFNVKNKSDGRKVDIDLSKPFEVAEGATGFMLIQRKVFERYGDQLPELYYAPDHMSSKDFSGKRMIMRYFDCEVERGWTNVELERFLRAFVSGSVPKSVLKDQANAWLTADEEATRRYLSEDYWFCKNAWATGSKVWMCPFIELKHIGNYTFTGNLYALASLDN